jgi:hypothetical protein
MKRSVRAEAHALAARYPGKDDAFLVGRFRASRFMERFGRVRDFERSDEYRNWTFWSYASKAGNVFGPLGSAIFKQLKGYRASADRLIQQEVRDAIDKRKSRRLDPQRQSLRTPGSDRTHCVPSLGN